MPICSLCSREFTPNKYRPNQKVCSEPDCQHKRQISNMSDWRGENPHYFKVRGRDLVWKELCKNRAKNWRERHRRHIRTYRRDHQDSYRVYMREYMRGYRLRQKLWEKSA